MNNKKGGVSPKWRTSETAVGVRGEVARPRAQHRLPQGAGLVIAFLSLRCFIQKTLVLLSVAVVSLCLAQNLPCSEPALQPRRRRRGRPALAGRAAASFPPSRRRRGNGRLQLPPAAGWTALLAVFFLPVVLPVRSSAALCNPCSSEWKPCFHI